MSSNAKDLNTTQVDEDDEPDDWDKRINNTGCADENLKLTLCHAEKMDWRQCVPEMEAFKKCWESHNNNQRTSTKNR